jgi:hypothetical protein
MLTLAQFSKFWKRAGSGDKHSTVFNILKAEGNTCLYPVDFEPLLYGMLFYLIAHADLVENHQGVVFLRGEAMNEFRRRYGITVFLTFSGNRYYPIIFLKTKQLYRTNVPLGIQTLAVPQSSYSLV